MPGRVIVTGEIHYNLAVKRNIKLFFFKCSSRFTFELVAEMYLKSKYCPTEKQKKNIYLVVLENKQTNKKNLCEKACH